MKNNKTFCGIAALVLLFTLIFSGCGNISTDTEATAPDKLYTVSFDVNGGTGAPPAAKKADPGETVILPLQGGLSRDNHTFKGWNEKADGSGPNYVALYPYPVTESITLYARWAAAGETIYTVNFSVNGGLGIAIPQQVIAGSTIVLPDATGFTFGDKTFGGWNTESDGTGNTFAGGSSFTVNDNITFYALWLAPGTELFTVTFDKNGGGGTMPAPVKAAAETLITLPGISGILQLGTSFDCWNTKANGSGDDYYVGDLFEVTGNTTLYAQWTSTEIARPRGYTVTYDANGASGTPPPDETVAVPRKDLIATVTLPEKGTLAKIGYSFDGWNTVKNGTEETSYAPGDVYKVTGNVTFYAEWVIRGIEIPVSPKQVTLTFNANTGNGTPPDPITKSTREMLEGGIPIPGPGDLTKVLYTFNGWNTTANGLGTRYVEGDIYTGSTATLYAQWKSRLRELTPGF